MGQPNGEGKGVSFRGRLWLVSKPDLSGAGLSNLVQSKKVEVKDHGRYIKTLLCEAH